MARVAILSHLPAVGAGMRVIVAAEASGKIGVTDIHRILAPCDIHIGEDVALPDRQKFPAAIITLDTDYLPIWASAHGRDGASRAELAVDPDLLADLERGIESVNERFTRAYQIKKFTVVTDEWLPNSDVLTPTFKLKRRNVAARYAAEIAEMYA